MPLNALFDGLDNIANAGRFFVALTERLGDGTLVADEDATQLARALGVPIPAELAGVSIVSLGESGDADRKAGPCAARSPLRIVVTYPPVVTPSSGEIEKTFKKCFRVCQTVGGAKVCAEVCVDIHIGFSGVGGTISASVSVAF